MEPNTDRRILMNAAQVQQAIVRIADAICSEFFSGGVITPATEIGYDMPALRDDYDPSPYEKRVYHGFGKPIADEPLRYGPNIRPWPEMVRTPS